MRRMLASKRLGCAAAAPRRILRIVPAMLWLAAHLSMAAAASEASGTALSGVDLQLAAEARQQALETKLSQAPTFWTNEATGNAGVITPLRTYRTSTGYYCRVYQERIHHRTGSPVTRTATACRDDGGVWRNISEN